MSIIERVKALDLPLDHVVVIGSGLLDALGIREAHDLDLIVTERLFTELNKTNLYEAGERNGSRYLLKDDVEVWLDWAPNIPDFTRAKSESVSIDGVAFLTPEALIREKTRMNRSKDQQDVRLLKEFIDNNPAKYS